MQIPDIPAEVVSLGIAAEVFGITIGGGGSWIFPRDPNFEAKAGRAINLCARTSGPASVREERAAWLPGPGDPSAGAAILHRVAFCDSRRRRCEAPAPHWHSAA